MWHQMPCGGFSPAQLLQQALARGDQPLGHDAVLDDLAFVVDVVDEQVERVDALLQPALDRAPTRATSMIRGTMSKGQTFSVPASWP